MRHVRVRLVRDFCVIPNAMSQSCGLSPSGLGLAAYISSMPDDAPVGVKPLADRFRVSQQQIAEGLRELVFAGLLARDRVNLPDGRLCTDVSFTGIPGGAGPSRETLAHQLAHKGVRYSAAHRRRLSDILACRAAARRRALAAVAEGDGDGDGQSGGTGDHAGGGERGGAQAASATSNQRPGPLRRPVRAAPDARPRRVAPAGARAPEAAAPETAAAAEVPPQAVASAEGSREAVASAEVAAPTTAAPAEVAAPAGEARRFPVQAQAAAPRRPHVRPVNRPVPDTIGTLGDALAGLIPAPAPARESPAPGGTPAARIRTPRPALQPASGAAPQPAPGPGPAPEAAPGPARGPASGPGRGAAPEAGHGTAPASGHARMGDEPAPPAPTAPELDEAVRLLASLRRVDPRLVLGARDVGRLAPTVAAWLAAGIHPDDVIVIVSGGLPPGEITYPAGFVARRLGGGMPPPLTAVPVAGHDGAAALREPPAPRRPLPFVNCTCCDRAIRGHRDTLCPECAATGCRPTGDTGSRTGCPNLPRPAVGPEPRPRRWGWQAPERS